MSLWTYYISECDNLHITEYEFSEIGKIIRSQLILDNGFCLSDNGKILEKTYVKNRDDIWKE